MRGMRVGRWLLLAAALAVVGCDEVGDAIDDWRYKGTHLGVQKCIDRNKVDVVSIVTIRTNCVKKHEKAVSVFLDGQASYSAYFGAGRLYFSGHVTNKTSQYIVTSFSIEVTHDDMEPGKKDVMFFDKLWLEPGVRYDFSIPATDLTFQPDINRLNDGDEFYYSWTPRSPMGVEINVD